MGYRKNTLRTVLKVIEALLQGPHTVKEIADIAGLQWRIAYGYVAVVSEFMPVQSVIRKVNPKGSQPKFYWIER